MKNKNFPRRTFLVTILAGSVAAIAILFIIFYLNHRPVSEQTNTVFVRILDEYGHPTPVRVRFTGPDSIYYAPDYHAPDFPVSRSSGDVILDDQRRFAYVDGQFKIQLPSKEITYEVVKGFAYRIIKESVTISPGSDTINIQLKKWFEFPGNPWYSGDIHVHQIPPETALLETKAEDLNVCNILINDWTGDKSNFIGRPDPVSDSMHIIYFNQELREDRLGHTVLLNLKELIEPVTPQRKAQYPLNLSIYDKVHSQGGHLSWAHFVQRMGVEWSLAAVLGKINSVELLCNIMPFLWAQRQADILPEWQANSGLDLWYRLLNCGLAVPITAGTDKSSNIVTVGANRVFGAVHGDFTYQAWIDALNEGRTFVSNSPFLFLTINGKEPGEKVHLKQGDSVVIKADVWSQMPLDRLEIIANGELIAEQTISPEQEYASLTLSYKPQKSVWIAARAYRFYAEEMERGINFSQPRSSGGGPTFFNMYYGTNLPETTFAHTSPLYLFLNNEPIRSQEDALYFVRHIENAIHWLQGYGAFPSDKAKNEVLEKFGEGRKEFLKLSL